MDRGVWWATVHGITKNRTPLRDQHFHFHFRRYVGASENWGLNEEKGTPQEAVAHTKPY